MRRRPVGRLLLVAAEGSSFLALDDGLGASSSRALADGIDDAGGGWLMSEDTFTPEALVKRLDSLFGLPVVLKRTAANARAAGRPKAVDELADMVVEALNEPAQTLTESCVNNNCEIEVEVSERGRTYVELINSAIR